MNEPKRVKPLFPGALTMEDVGDHEQIIYWIQGDKSSIQRVTVAREPYQDAEEHWVIDITREDGRTVTVYCSEIGLCGHQTSGKWTHVAVRNLENG